MKKEDIKILLVDDEPDILEIVGYNLKKEGYQVFEATNGFEAVKMAKRIYPNLIILDVMMPEMDGIEACKIIRKTPKLDDVIIAFLTARSEEFSQLAGLNAGADDYITKPIKPKILVSKVKALLRRLKDKSTSLKAVIIIGDLHIDSESYRVTYKLKNFSLPKKEFELLYLLATKPNKVFKRNDIMDNIWGTDVIVGDRTIDVHIRKLRKKINEKFLKTVKGVGYKLMTDEV